MLFIENFVDEALVDDVMVKLQAELTKLKS